MTDAELEAWARDIIDRVGRTSQLRLPIELKTYWIPPDQAARRLAGHANAVRSDEVLWLISVNDRAATIPGAPAQELAN